MVVARRKSDRSALDAAVVADLGGGCSWSPTHFRWLAAQMLLHRGWHRWDEGILRTDAQERLEKGVCFFLGSAGSLICMSRVTCLMENDDLR